MTPAEQVIKSLREEPDKWKKDYYRLTHDNGTRIWIASGLSFYKIDEPSRRLSFYEKVCLAFAIKKWERRPLPNFKWELSNHLTLGQCKVSIPGQ